METKSIAVAGATGLVGREMLRTLAARNFPIRSIKLLASERSKGKTIPFNGAEIAVEVLTEDSFEGVDIALFSAGGGTSKQFAPAAAKAGCVVIDNSSAWRMDPNVPLVVPEVNPDAARNHQGIIANPNCSTIQMVVALQPIHQAVGIERLIVSTYQAVSGAGAAALEELFSQTIAVMDGQEPKCNVFPHPIAFNCIPQIPQSDAFQENGYSTEEMKMINETKKIMSAPDMRISVTTVRVPVHTGHSESVTIETREKISPADVRELLSKAPGVVVEDDLANQRYPLASNAAGKGDTFVGRIREDLSSDRGICMWIVSDNLLKGAALNAVQIAEIL